MTVTIRFIICPFYLPGVTFGADCDNNAPSGDVKAGKKKDAPSIPSGWKERPFFLTTTYDLLRRRRTPTRPTPSKDSVAGSGTVVIVYSSTYSV